MQRKKIAVVAALALAAGVFIGLAVNPPQARANAVTDFFNKLLSPFFVQSSGTAPTVQSPAPVPLYQPVIDYEQAVVDAVKKASPAVVSIVISKNVPIVEQCPYNPFGNLPPEFQQFF